MDCCRLWRVKLALRVVATGRRFNLEGKILPAGL